MASQCVKIWILNASRDEIQSRQRSAAVFLRCSRRHSIPKQAQPAGDVGLHGLFRGIKCLDDTPHWGTRTGYRVHTHLLGKDYAPRPVIVRLAYARSPVLYARNSRPPRRLVSGDRSVPLRRTTRCLGPTVFERERFQFKGCVGQQHSA